MNRFREKRKRVSAWSDWKERFFSRRPSLGRRKSLLLSRRQFDRELSRERIRSLRRSIPFCVLTIEQSFADSTRNGQRNRQARKLVDILHHQLRMTDEKGILDDHRYGVLLVDTPEMGGRAVYDRLLRVAAAAGLRVALDLQVHDPDGFGDGDENVSTSSQKLLGTVDRRRDDPDDATWGRSPKPIADSVRFSESAAPVNVVPPVNLAPPVTVASSSHRATGVWSTSVPCTPKRRLVMHIKRSMDVVGAGAGLVIAGPAILAAMAAIRLTDGGPAFFCQTREGHLGRPFTIYKLRTMVVDAEKLQGDLRKYSHRDGPAFKISGDPRVTAIGRFLRASCLDELPQLINVLRGDMSLVGPRPLPWHESRACQRWHRRRLDVRPGLTCIWQVDKARAETFDDWMRMDLRYIDRIGVLADLKLIVRTMMVPVTGRGGE